MKLISVVTPCYNEEENVEDLCRAIAAQFSNLPGYDFEHLLIDNGSTDATPEILRRTAATDPRVKVILNRRNFGHVRSFYHAVLESRGDATIVMASDFQDPPEYIPRFIRKWEEGNPIVLAVKTESRETPAIHAVRKLYYALLNALSDVPLVKDATGFGIYDQKVVAELRKLEDPYPYFRGLVIDLGFKPALIEFVQPRRKRGFTKNNFYTLYDMAMLGITNHSKLPLRLAAFIGFGMSFLSFLTGIAYLIYKLLFWDRFSVGMAPVVIGLFLFSSVQLFFIGILGEYIGAIHTQVLRRPLVVEKERINFDT